MTPPSPPILRERFPCVHCGAILDLDGDSIALHVECRYCGQDNPLPEDVVIARRRHQLEQERQAQQQLLREQMLKDQVKTRRRATVILALVLVGGGFLTARCVENRKNEEAAKEAAEKARAARLADPMQNGQTRLAAELERLRRDNGCDRVFGQPEVVEGGRSRVAVDIKFGKSDCAHILGVTGTGVPITMEQATGQALSRALPAPSEVVDFEFCPQEPGHYEFAFTTPDDVPYSTAMVQCPLPVQQGGSRSRMNDANATGSFRAEEVAAKLERIGCRRMDQVTLFQNAAELSFTSQAGAGCITVLVMSGLDDVRIQTSWTGPDATVLPSPPARKENRAIYCPHATGSYKLTALPTTSDYFSMVALDCPRSGPEGEARHRQLFSPP